MLAISTSLNSIGTVLVSSYILLVVVCGSHSYLAANGSPYGSIFSLVVYVCNWGDAQFLCFCIVDEKVKDPLASPRQSIHHAVE